ncbi:MAG: acyl-CoA dehydrogenase family protein [Phenylobacterium sp.]
MDLQLAPADLAFREEVRAFLDAHLTEDLRAAGAARTGSFCDLAPTAKWHATLHRKGWVAPDWPVEHGGTGWTTTERHIFASECASAGAPGIHSFGIRMCGPVIIGFGTPEQQAYYLPRILSGEHRWCQGYSEPGSGSDLASLQTRAQPDGDDYVVNGTKIWTSLAHQATHIFCLVRTDLEAKPQRGISFLLIDRNTPGLTMRPIINISGEHEFNQVFFDDVRVPKSQRIGAENEGWTVAKYLLEFERGGNYANGLWARLKWVRDLASRYATEDAGFGCKLAQVEIDITAVEMQEHRVVSARALGESPGAAASMLKLQGNVLTQRLDELAIEALGPQASHEGREAAVAMGRYLYDRAVTILGGTSEIQRNIMARAMLGI